MAKRLVACLITIFMLLTFSAVSFAQVDTPPLAGDNLELPPPPPDFDEGDEVEEDVAPVVESPVIDIKPNADEPVLLITEETEKPDMEIIDSEAVDPIYNWTMFRKDPFHSGISSEQVEFPLKLMWRQVAKLTYNDLQKNNGNPSSPSVADGVIYFCAAQKIHAVNADTGSLRWVYPEEGSLNVVIKSTPLIGEDLIYVGAGDGRLYAITKQDGRLAWSFTTKGIMNSSPIIVEDTLFVGSSDNNLYALDPQTGQQKWTSGFKTHDDISGSPAAANGLVYFISNDMSLYCAHISTGRLKWAIKVGSASKPTTPVIAGNNLYVAVGSSLQCLQVQSGRLVWSAKLPEEISALPAVSEDAIYVVSRKKLYALTLAGRYKWKQPVDLGAISYAPPTLAGNYVITGNSKGVITIVNKETGVVVWKYMLTPATIEGGRLPYTGISSTPVVSNGTLYVMSDDGVLSAFNNRIPDTSPPYVTAVQPSRDYLMPGTPPLQIAAIMKDPGSGINEDSIEMMLDGVPVQHTYVPETGVVWYRTLKTQPVRPLSDGRHTVTLIATDWAGNKMLTEWSFRVDNALKIAPDTKPKTDQQTPGGMMPGMMPGMGGGMLTPPIGGMPMPPMR